MVHSTPPRASAMARLLTNARLTTLDPRVPQIFTAPAAYQVRGDFGLKRPLPTTGLRPGSIRYVDVERLDSYDQTIWTESERPVLLRRTWQETGARLSQKDFHASNHTKTPTLGPRIQSQFDPATKRPLPSHFKRQGIEPDATLISEAKQGQGRRYNGIAVNTGAELDPFAEARDGYSLKLPLAADYQSMSEAAFQRYLARLRRQRPALRNALALESANRARRITHQRYEEERKEAKRAADRARADGATPVAVPPERQLADMPMIALSEVEIDMWDASRAATHVQWSDWLQYREDAQAARSRDRRLYAPGTTEADMSVPVKPQPIHPNGGLQYAQPDAIYSAKLAPPLKGHVLNYTSAKIETVNRSLRRTSAEQGKDALAVAIGGRITLLPNSLAEGLRLVDYSRHDVKSGAGQFRVTGAQLLKEREVRQPGSAALQPELGYILANVRAIGHATGPPFGAPGSPEWIAKHDGNVRAHVRDVVGGSLSSNLYSPRELLTSTQRAKNRRDEQKRLREGRLGTPGVKSGQSATAVLLDRLKGLSQG